MAVAAGGAGGWGFGGCGGGGGFGGGGGGDKFWFNPMSLLEDMEDDEEEDEELLAEQDMIKVLKKKPNSRDIRLAKRRKTRRHQLNQMVKCSQLSCFKTLHFVSLLYSFASSKTSYVIC